MFKVPVYLVEKATGLKDENGVELYYAIAARLTRSAAETEFKTILLKGEARVRKLTASK